MRVTGEAPELQALRQQIAELEAELAQRRTEVDELLELLPVAMVEIELATLRVVSMNRLARIVLGYDPDGEPPALTTSDIVTPEEFSRLLAVTMETQQKGLQPDGTYRRTGEQEIFETVGVRRDGSRFPVEFQPVFVLNDEQVPVASRLIFRDISTRKAAEAEREQLVAELREALSNVRKLEGLLPICAWCKKVRDDGGYWSELEAYVDAHSDARFSHGICPSCARQFEEEYTGTEH